MKAIVVLLFLLCSITQINAHNRPNLRGYARSIDDLDEIPKDAKSIKLVLSEESSGKLLEAAAIRFPQLESLSVYNLNREGRVTEVRELARLAQLRKLEFMGDRGPSDEVVVEIAKLKKLVFLRLYFEND